MTRRFSVPLAVAFLFAADAGAQLPLPKLARIAPMGGGAGTSFWIEVQGADLDGPGSLKFDHPGIRAARWPTSKKKFLVTVAAEVPVGTRECWYVGKLGVSNSRLFAISKGLAELNEAAGNNSPETAQEVPVNSVVNGASDGNRDDHFRVTLKKDRRIVVECAAQRLDSMLDGVLTLSSADGKQLAANGDTHGTDPLLDFLAPADGAYIVRLNDIAYRGDRPYRLTITDRPHVENAFPAVVQAGKPTTLTLLGRNLGPKAKPSAWKLNELPLDESMLEVTAPPDVFEGRKYHFFGHPTGHSVSPTAATASLTGFQPSPDAAIPLVVVDTPVTLEAEPNDDRAKPQALTLPAALSGRFDRERDADWFEFTADADGPHTFEVFGERIGGQADPYFVLFDDKDARIVEHDDSGPRFNSFDALSRDPSAVIDLKAKAKYRLLVQDRYRRGGARYRYVLQIEKARPDFIPFAIAPFANAPSSLNLRRGGTAHLDIGVMPQGKLAVPVTFTGESLPKGVTVRPTILQPGTTGALVLHADADAAESVGPIVLKASATIGDRTVVREVRFYVRVSTVPEFIGCRPTREMMLAVLPEKSPFALDLAEERIEIVAGSKRDVTIKLSRLWPEFAGAVTVTALPGTVKLDAVRIAEGGTEAKGSLSVPAGTPPREYSLTLAGQAQVPFAVESDKAKAMRLVTLPSRTVTVVVLPEPKK